MSKADCVVQKAPGYIGMPYYLGEEGHYVVGKEQTKAIDIDCSGLVYALFRDCNVLLNGKPFPRETADDYWRRADPITKPERVGDCCWFPRTGRKTHIAMYIGNNQVIEAGNHGPNNAYPGSGYTGTCTVSQMNYRGAAWGRFRGIDIGTEVRDMTDEQDKMLRQMRLSDLARSFDMQIIKMMIEGNALEAARLEAEKTSTVAVERKRLGL